VPHPSDQLRLNVGFLLNQPVGSSRDFDFDIPVLHLDPDLDLHNLTGEAKFTRTAQSLLAQVSMQAIIDADCVRCLTNSEQTLQTEFTELYAFSPDSVTDSQLLVPETAQINLAPLVREYMLLEIPISPLCRPDCKGLCPVCGENLNENMHQHDDEDTDPRLSGLKELLDKD
jgi:uncharacterized protein